MVTVGKHHLSRRTRRRQWTLVALLVLAGCVNYVDRSTLAIANHDIASDLHLSPTEMGALLSAFAWTYALFQLPAGILTDRFGPHLMLAAGMVLWSLAQILSGTVRTFGQFVTTRAALGFGESPMFTAGARACVDWFPVKQRGLPLGLFNAASSLGPAIAPPLLTALMLAFGWRAMFMAMGVVGLLVALAWALAYRPPEDTGIPVDDLASIRQGNRDAGSTTGPALWGRLFTVPTTWALIGGLFGIVYVTWLTVSWLPDYLENVRHVSVARTGFLAAIPQLAGFFGGCLGGFVSDALAHRGIEPIRARKIPTIAGLAMAGVLTAVAPFVADTGLALAILSLAMFFAYGAGSCSWALGAGLTPPAMVATLESVQNIGGSIGGALAPLGDRAGGAAHRRLQPGLPRRRRRRPALGRQLRLRAWRRLWRLRTALKRAAAESDPSAEAGEVGGGPGQRPARLHHRVEDRKMVGASDRQRPCPMCGGAGGGVVPRLATHLEQFVHPVGDHHGTRGVRYRLMRDQADRRQFFDLGGRDAQRVVEGGPAQWREVEDAADRQAGVDLRRVSGQRREVTTGRPARHHEPAAMATVAVAEERQGRADLGGDPRQAGVRRQRIADDGDIHAERQRTRGHAGETFFGVAHPPAAVNEGEERRTRRSAGEQVEAVAGKRTVAKI